jgi:hypothetical protein
MNKVESILTELEGEYCWGIDWDRQFNLSLNFGAPALSIHPVRRSKRIVTPRGCWKLWVFCAYWTISLDGTAAATGASSVRRIMTAMARLDGQAFITSAVDSRNGRTVLNFDLGGSLEIRRWTDSKEYEMWILSRPRRRYLTVRSDAHFQSKQGNRSAPWRLIDG